VFVVGTRRAYKKLATPLTSIFDDFVGIFVSQLGNTSSKTLLPGYEGTASFEGASF
jgi:hypothetical protein